MTAHPAILLVLPLAGSLAAQPGPNRESQVMAERADKDATFATSPTSPLAGVDRRTFPAGTQVWLGAFGTGYATGQAPLEGGRFRLTAEDHRWAWVSQDGAERGWVTPGKEFRMGTRTVVAYPQPEALTVLCFDTARPERQAFTGLRYFKYDPGYAAQATLRPVTPPVKVVMGTSRNQEKTFYRYAEILFTLGGKPRRLAAYKYELTGPDSEILFIPFTDLTTGKETYAAGRFLEIPDPHATGFTLDFNQAFNPLCNYSDSYNCPRPPAENALPVAIRAGELTYGQALSAPGRSSAQEAGNMMLRMWHGTTARDKADRYERFLVGRAIPDYRSVPGNLDASILRRDEGDLSHFLTITHWISEDAIRAFAGSEVLKAKYYPEDEEYLLEFEPSVQHYGVVATEHAPGPRLLAPPRLPGAIPGEPSLNRAVPDPFEFGRHWLEAWNAHDLEALLAHFDEAVVFTSPVAAQLLTGSEGVIRGKGALRTYWTEALRRIPDLRFDLIGVYAGIRSLVINFRNQKGGLANEVLIFDQGLVTEGHGTYLDRGGNLAGASE